MSDLISKQVLELWNRYKPTIAVDAIEYDRELRRLLSTNLAEVGTDCISREQAIKAIEEEWDGCCSEYPATQIIYDTTEAIERIPAIQPKRGKWISADAIFGGVPFYCSECGENTRDTVMGEPRWNFCPNCGADMRQKGEDSESN